MKKTILLLLLLSGILRSNAQSLAGTQWLGTNPPSPNLWFNFETDTVYYSFTGSGFLPVSLYSASSGQFWIMDLSGTALCTDTGFYNYSYVGSTLTFSLIADGCASRRNTLLNYNWTLIGTTGMESILVKSGISAFPNPSPDGRFTIKSTNVSLENSGITIYDLNGRLVISQEQKENETTIDLTEFPSGIYTCFIQNGETIIPIKLVR